MRLVRDVSPVVEVNQICPSSCADYVFPAGRACHPRARICQLEQQRATARESLMQSFICDLLLVGG